MSMRAVPARTKCISACNFVARKMMRENLWRILSSDYIYPCVYVYVVIMNPVGSECIPCVRVFVCDCVYVRMMLLSRLLLVANVFLV